VGMRGVCVRDRPKSTTVPPNRYNAVTRAHRQTATQRKEPSRMRRAACRHNRGLAPAHIAQTRTSSLAFCSVSLLLRSEVFKLRSSRDPPRVWLTISCPTRNSCPDPSGRRRRRHRQRIARPPPPGSRNSCNHLHATVSHPIDAVAPRHGTGASAARGHYVAIAPLGTRYRHITRRALAIHRRGAPLPPTHPSTHSRTQLARSQASHLCFAAIHVWCPRPIDDTGPGWRL